MIKYESTRSYAATEATPYRQEEREFDTMDEARAWVMADPASCSGSVITWHVGPNLPGCLPALRYSSCALDVHEHGAWRGVNIHE